MMFQRLSCWLLISLLCLRDVSASESSESSIMPLDFLFSTSDPHIQVRTICTNSEEWFKNYITNIKANGYDLNTSFKDGDTLLHMAIREGCPNMVKALLEAKVDVFKKNSQSESPLDSIRYFLNHGQGYEAVWEVFDSAGYKLEANNDGNVSESDDSIERENPKKIARTGSIDGNGPDFLNGPLAKSPVNFQASEGDLRLDFIEIAQLFNNQQPAKPPLPIPPKYMPDFRTPVVVDPNQMNMGEIFTQI